MGSMDTDTILLGPEGVSAALGPNAFVTQSTKDSHARTVGAVLGAAAVNTGFRSYTGTFAAEERETALAVGLMALVFDSESTAEKTFASVGEAAHLRTRLGSSLVAVETVTSAGGLVSYWGYVQHANAILVVTLDTLDPQHVSMTEFRSLITASADHLERALRTA